MLLFIDEHSVRDPDLIVISKHLMLLFIKTLFSYRLLLENFKTSHVIVYRGEFRLDRLDKSISKHLMLLFIVFKNLSATTLLHFKTSHVIVYRRTKSGCDTAYDIFQNISCYCLSVIFDSEFRRAVYFKTSHVIVYHSGSCPRFSGINISKHLMLLFIC